MPGKTVAIVQSNYIPWKGYFDLIRRADEFILYDDVQYTRRDWRNRNRIKTPQGVQWLTIPVSVKGKYCQSISETRVSDPDWARVHWRTIQCSYAKAPFFSEYAERFERLYATCDADFLSHVNHRFLLAVCEILGIGTPIRWSSEYELAEGKTERLVSLCRQAGATRYLSGPAARAYLQEDLFRAVGIDVEYMDYGGYPEYHQLYPPFDHAVSILDLIFNEGPQATRFMRSLVRAAA